MMMGIGIGLIVLETVILLSGHWLTLILGLLSGGTGYGLCKWLSHQVAVHPPERSRIHHPSFTYNGPAWETVWVSEANDGFRFNEEHNSYGKSLTARAMERAKTMMNNCPSANARGGTPPQTEAFKEVIAEEISRLLARGNFTVPVGHTVHCVKRAIMGIYVFLIQIATYQGRIARDLRRRTYQAAYAAIYNFDNRPEVHQLIESLHVKLVFTETYVRRT